MNSTERRGFWDALCSIRDNTPEHIQELTATIKLPEYLCRFRAVNENSLNQLQENKLYYSSADYYDDPFDTFIHVDHARIKELLTMLREHLDFEDPKLLNRIKAYEPVIGISAEQFLNELKEHPFDLSGFPDRIKQVRTQIQKTLFSICFCEDELNETLWLKYAKNYSGFVLVYDFQDNNTFLCGKEDVCKNCRSLIEKPSVYPVYYTEEAHDATQYALANLIWGSSAPQQIKEFSYQTVMWEAERISLIKKKCHEYDKEWRMIRPSMMPDRTCIKLKPQRIILGLRMPEYERLLVISAAKVAGISNIEELFINENDQLDSRSIVRI